MILDDQLPSGFHYSLPLSVSNFQIVTQEESNNLIKKEPILAVTQQSFDLENFSYLVSCKLCEKEKKYFKCIQDWYSEILKVLNYNLMLVNLLSFIFTFISRSPQ